MPQGSRGARLAWDVIFGLACRCAASTFLADEYEVYLQAYVDDPLAIVTGSKERIGLLIGRLILMWRTLGFPLSFKKGQRGQSLKWIVAKLSLTAQGIRAEIPTDKVNELTAITTQMLSANVISIKDVRMYVGKAQHIASLLHVWRHSFLISGMP